MASRHGAQRRIGAGFALTAVILGSTVGFATSAAGAAPNRAAKYPVKGTYAYQSVYSGTYEFSYEITAHSKTEDVHWTSDDDYTWNFDLLDVIHDDGDSRYTELRRARLAGQGGAVLRGRLPDAERSVLPPVGRRRCHEAQGPAVQELVPLHQVGRRADGSR